MEWIIRRAEIYDAPYLQTIYNHYTATSATLALETRTCAEQEAWIEEKNGAYAAFVAADAATNHALAFASYGPYRSRPGYSGTVENSIYVHPDHIGKKIGKPLLSHLIDSAREHGFHSMMAVIMSDNTPSIALHQKCGYDLVGIERQVGRKHGMWFDVALLQLMLHSSKAPLQT